MVASTAYERVVERLDTIGKKVRSHGSNYMAQCPAHDDRNPSLSITLHPGKIKLKCFAGCDDRDVLAAIGLTVKDLYDEPMTRSNNGHPRSKPPAKFIDRPKDPETWIADLAKQQPIKEPPNIYGLPELKPDQDVASWLREITNELSGYAIYGGCEDCEAYQTLREDQYGMFHIHTWHDDDCPRQPRSASP